MFRNNSIFSNIPPVTKNLLILNILLWAVMALVPSMDRLLTQHFALYYFTSSAFKPFQLLTYMFLHAGFTHLFFNMFALFMFGRTIEWSMGSARFLFYYLSCGIGAALVQLGVYAWCVHDLVSILPPEAYQEVLTRGWEILQQHMNYSDPDLGLLNAYVNSPLVGASGAVYGVLLAFGYLFPNQPIYLFFIPVPIKSKWIIIGYFVIELVYGLGGVADNVAHFAHLGGMIFGFLLLVYWKRRGVFNNRWFF